MQKVLRLLYAVLTYSLWSWDTVRIVAVVNIIHSRAAILQVEFRNIHLVLPVSQFSNRGDFALEH